MNRLPQSPMNSRARLRFQYRNPSSAPASDVSRTTTAEPRYPGINAARKPAAISPTPAARPSMLSSRFIAWQMPREPDDRDEREERRQRAVRFRAGQRKHQERADRQRRHQLRERRELQPVVEDADDEHRERGERHRNPVRWRTDEIRAAPPAPGTQRSSPPRSRSRPSSASATVCQRSGRGGHDGAARRRVAAHERAADDAARQRQSQRRSPGRSAR